MTVAYKHQHNSSNSFYDSLPSTPKMSCEMNISQLRLHVLKVKRYRVLLTYVELLKQWNLNLMKRVLLEP